MIHADLGDPDSSSWKPLQADLGLPWWRDHCTCGLQVGQYLGALACPFSWPAFWPADLLIQLPQSHKPFLLQICFSGWALIEICQLRLAVYWFLFFFFGKDTGFFFFFFSTIKTWLLLPYFLYLFLLPYFASPHIGILVISFEFL